MSSLKPNAERNRLRKLRRKVFRVLEDFDKESDKEGILKFINELEDHMDFSVVELNSLKNKIKHIDDNQWNIIVGHHNGRVRKEIKERNKEVEAYEKFCSMIEQDDILKHHNVDCELRNFMHIEDNEFVAKIYLICGAFLFEGTLQEIISLMKRELKKRNVKIKILCLNCSSKKLSFMNHYCLCKNCGCVSNIDENKVVDKFDEKDRDFWNAKFLVFQE